jgi:hypothetical protein
MRHVSAGFIEYGELVSKTWNRAGMCSTNLAEQEQHQSNGDVDEL